MHGYCCSVTVTDTFMCIINLFYSHKISVILSNRDTQIVGPFPKPKATVVHSISYAVWDTDLNSVRRYNM